MDKPWVRFWRKVEVIPNGCWLWTAGKFPNGYGCFSLGVIPRRNVGAHRFAYEHFVGPIPEDKELDHLCRVRHCVNPQHLEPVTRSENLLRSPLIGQANRKTHCKRGHPLEGANLYIKGDFRSCRACKQVHKQTLRKNVLADESRLSAYREADAERARVYRARKAGRETLPWRGIGWKKDKTHCPQGHAYEGENLYVTPAGERKCRACTREANRRAYLKRSHNVEQE
jgi:hypothetical protein